MHLLLLARVTYSSGHICPEPSLTFHPRGLGNCGQNSAPAHFVKLSEHDLDPGVAGGVTGTAEHGGCPEVSVLLGSKASLRTMVEQSGRIFKTYKKMLVGRRLSSLVLGLCLSPSPCDSESQ